MNSDAPGPLQVSPDQAIADPAPVARRAGWNAYLELTKPRLSLLSVITALVGYLAAQPARDSLLLLHVLIGTALAAGGVAAVNQWIERETDGRMTRTQDRPLPSGAISPAVALLLGLAMTLAGIGVLAWGANLLAAALGLATAVSYLLIYTPLKRTSRWSTEVGAVSGALPPLIGWAAAEGSISGLGWILFGILFFWQIPHFMAVAWIYRGDYSMVHFPMLPVLDTRGHRVAAWSLFNLALLVAISLLPYFLGYAGPLYLAAALVLGVGFAIPAIAFCRPSRRETAARQLFLASITYLPAILGALVIDRWW